MKIKYVKPKIPNNKKVKRISKPFSIECPIINFGEKGSKVLFVIDRVPSEDLYQKQLLSGKVGETLTSMIDVARDYVPVNQLAIVNFAAAKVVHLSETDKYTIEKEFFNRIGEFCRKYKPDCVLFFGLDHLQYMNIDGNFDITKDIGTVNEFIYKKKKYKFVNSLSISVFGTGDPNKYKSLPNLIGDGVEHMRTAFHGRNLYNITKYVDKAFKNIKFINNIKEFDKFFKKLLKERKPCIDTEGKSLARLDNYLASLQFFVKGRAYFLPYRHYETPFVASELKYIKKKLKWYFEHHEPDYIIFQNAKFDLTAIKNEFKIRFFAADVYDTMAGEYCLNENRRFLTDIKYKGKAISPYSLEFLEKKYGYKRPALATDKENRATIVSRPLSEVIEYASIDCITPYYIHICQLKEAKVRGKDYNRFRKIVSILMSDIIHMITGMEYNGTVIDKEYLLKSRSKDSEINKIISNINKNFQRSKYARKANEILLKERGAPKRSLYGASSWVFDIAKPHHKEVLFFDVMKIKPLSVGKSGVGSAGKDFQAKYKDKYKEVSWLNEWSKASILRNMFIEGIWKKLIRSPDAKIDGRLRAVYNYIRVLTGRLSAKDPNFQQIPSHGPLAKLIKRIFICLKYCILVEADYSAHEVRVWGNASKDKNLTNAFRLGLRARQEYRIYIYTNGKSITEKEIRRLKEKIEKDGDIHVQNCRFFYGRPPKDGSERQSIKAVVFGVIYDKAAPSLANDIRDNKAPDKYKDIVKKIRKGTENGTLRGKELDEAIAQKEKLEADLKVDYVEKAQGLIDKLFDKFSNGGKFLNDTKVYGRKHYRGVSPLGRVRHLWAYLHYEFSVKNMMDRRGPNSSIQGAASDIGAIAARELQKYIWHLFVSRGKKFKYQQFNTVHDSSKGMSSIIELPILLYLQEHAMTTAVHKKCREVFDFENLVDYETEVNIGSSQYEMEKWDWSLDLTEKHNEGLAKPKDAGVGLISIVQNSMEWAEKNLNHKYKKGEKEAMMKMMIHNANIINRIRLKELKLAIKSDKPNEYMYLTPENVDKFDFIFESDRKKLMNKFMSDKKNIDYKMAA